MRICITDLLRKVEPETERVVTDTWQHFNRTVRRQLRDETRLHLTSGSDRMLRIEVDGERYHHSWTGKLCMPDQLRNQRLTELVWEVKRFVVFEVRDNLDECGEGVADCVHDARGAA